MTPDRYAKVTALFQSARAQPASERQAFVCEQCGLDHTLRAEVERLLMADQATSSFLEAPALGEGFAAAAFERDILDSPDPLIGQTIGEHFRITGVLDKGGMSIVYRADQEHPKREVALKVMNVGIASRSELRRFWNESQFLASLQHIGIAQIYETGAFDIGRGMQPFFAMELIKGQSLTRFARDQELAVPQRLRLLVRICEAVQHAHGRGIIHRDLKPANILVDESGQPKVLDFGVARAIDSDIKATTLQTDIGQLVGTLSYMSPEQAGGNPRDLDTRSDVYALGVIAYELLSDQLPYDLSNKMIHEAARIIREYQPGKLSAVNRVLSGDLEVIVGKALEKDKERRYQTASELRADIERYMKHEPIAAQPPSAWYQLRKFSRRNKTLVGGVAVSFLLLLGGLGATLWQAARAETRAAELAKVSAFQAQMLSQVDPTIAGVRLSEDIKAKFQAALSKSGEPEPDRARRVEEFMTQWHRVNATDVARDLIDRTILQPAVAAINEQFKNQPVVDAHLRQVLATRYQELGMYDVAMPLQQQALEIRRQEFGEEHPNTLSSISSMGMLLMAQDKLNESEPYIRVVMENSRRVLGEKHPDTLYAIGNMGTLRRIQHNLDEADRYYREVLDTQRRVLGNDHPDTLRSIEHLGEVLQDRGLLSEAESCFRESLETRQRVQGDEYPRTLYTMLKLGVLLVNQDKLAEAEPYVHDTVEKCRRVFGREHPDTLLAIDSLAYLLRTRGDLPGAEACLREVLEVRRRTLGGDHRSTLTLVSNMGALLQAQGKLDEAVPYCREAMEHFRRRVGDEHPNTLISIFNMAALLQAQSKHAEVVQLLGPVELATRKVFIGADTRPLAIFLMRLGKAHKGLEEFAAAAANLVEASSILIATSGETHRETSDCIQTLVDLYTAWHAAEPGKGHDAKAAEWKTKLDAIQLPTTEPKPEDKK